MLQVFEHSEIVDRWLCASGTDCGATHTGGISFKEGDLYIWGRVMARRYNGAILLSLQPPGNHLTGRANSGVHFDYVLSKIRSYKKVWCHYLPQGHIGHSLNISQWVSDIEAALGKLIMRKLRSPKIHHAKVKELCEQINNYTNFMKVKTNASKFRQGDRVGVLINYSDGSSVRIGVDIKTKTKFKEVENQLQEPAGGG